jgi:peptidoglycan/xylan/chitin deacetylase (PgdA/CDA1 family)
VSKWLLPVIASIVMLGGSALADEPTAPAKSPPIILLKLDDVSYWITPRWTRVADYLKDKKIRASFGIIGQGLEKAKPETIDWIKKLHDDGQIEFWCHGWTLRKAEDKTGEFEAGTAEQQAALLRKAEDLAKEKLGFTYAAFGPHWTGTTDETDKALESIPEIKIWLYGPVKPKYFTRLSIPRVMALENPTFIPDFEKFKATYEKIGNKQKVLVLQGHPDQWADPKRWDGFTQIIDFLQAQGCTFMTPSEYLRNTSK